MYTVIIRKAVKYNHKQLQTSVHKGVKFLCPQVAKVKSWESNPGSVACALTTDLWPPGNHHPSQYMYWHMWYLFSHLAWFSTVHLKVTGTCSWMKSVCHKLACRTLKLPDFRNNQSLQRAFHYSSAAAWWSTSTNFYISLLTLLYTEGRIPAFYLFVWHCCRATQRKTFFFQLAIVCLRS